MPTIGASGECWGDSYSFDVDCGHNSSRAEGPALLIDALAHHYSARPKKMGQTGWHNNNLTPHTPHDGEQLPARLPSPGCTALTCSGSQPSPSHKAALLSLQLAVPQSRLELELFCRQHMQTQITGTQSRHATPNKQCTTSIDTRLAQGGAP
jgi:hypothetical protein